MADPRRLADIEARLSALEEQKLKVSDLPIEALRNALLKMQPSDPGEILLPHSITAGLLGEGSVTSDAIGVDAVTNDAMADDSVTGTNLNLQYADLPLSGDQALTTTPTTLTDCTYTPYSGGRFFVFITADVNMSVAGPVVAVGYVYLNGVQYGLSDWIFQPTGGTGRGNNSQAYVLDALTNDVIEYRAAKLINAGTVACLNTHTKMVVVQIG